MAPQLVELKLEAGSGRIRNHIPPGVSRSGDDVTDEQL